MRRVDLAQGNKSSTNQKGEQRDAAGQKEKDAAEPLGARGVRYSWQVFAKADSGDPEGVAHPAQRSPEGLRPDRGRQGTAEGDAGLPCLWREEPDPEGARTPDRARHACALAQASGRISRGKKIKRHEIPGLITCCAYGGALVPRCRSLKYGRVHIRGRERPAPMHKNICYQHEHGGAVGRRFESDQSLPSNTTGEVGRSKLYEIAGDNPGLFKKLGGTTIVRSRPCSTKSWPASRPRQSSRNREERERKKENPGRTSPRPCFGAGRCSGRS